MKKVMSLLLVFLFSFSLYAFPLRNIGVGDRIDFSNIKSINGNIDNFLGKKVKKIVFIWRFDKELSKKLYADFVKLCVDKKVSCMSIEISNIDRETLLNFHKIDEILLTKGDEKFANTIGVYTLPVTIFLDEDNRILNAIGYEGNYLFKISKYLDLITGVIGSDEYEKTLKKTEVVKDKSAIPDINLAIRFIKESKIGSADEILKKISTDQLGQGEKIKIAEAYILLSRLKDAEAILLTINIPLSEFLIAYIKYLEKKYTDSLSILERIEKVYPEKKKINHLKGLIFFNQKDYEKASKFFYSVLGEEIL